MDKTRLISIKIRQKVLSFYEGLHKALKFGEEDDLKNIREYTYGDNVKRINWIITAKEKKPFVIEREERKNQNIIVVMLLDQEMLYGKKLQKLYEIYSIIGFSALYQKDRLNTYVFTDRMEKFFNHRNTFSVVEDVLKFVDNLSLKDKKLNPKQIDRYLLKHRRSIVILIGDFVYPINISPISSRHKLFVIKVREKDEEDPKRFISYQLKSFDLKRRIPVLIKPMVRNYIKNLKDLDQKLRQQAVLNRVPVKTIYTHEDPFLKLRMMFS